MYFKGHRFYVHGAVGSSWICVYSSIGLGIFLVCFDGRQSETGVPCGLPKGKKINISAFNYDCLLKATFDPLCPAFPFEKYKNRFLTREKNTDFP